LVPFFQAEITLKKREREDNVMPEKEHASWGELLRDAVEKPGRMLEAYTAFHNYSIGNALLALGQCIRRNLQPGPLNTYPGWLERKRQVRKGEKGITLCMPVPFNRTMQAESVPDDTTEPETRYAFRFRAYWFVLAQTEGEDTDLAPTPGFAIDTALRTLNITRTSFDEINGNVQGFARAREIAVSPLAALPHKTTFHELAHIVLRHTTTEKLVDSEQTAVHIREVEAESVALICCETLGLDGAEFCRGYIQHWLKAEKEIPNHSAGRIFAAATSILKAGNPMAGSL
jgi:antirestriction protein ArdC